MFQRLCRRDLTFACMLLLAAQAASASVNFEGPGLREARETIASSEKACPPDGDCREVSALSFWLEERPAPAPRVHEARENALVGALKLLLLHLPDLGFAPRESEERGTPASDAITRWCLAHATSTQAP
jgi:hypothetical protein